MTEVIVAKNEIVYALNNIHSWVKPTYVSKNMLQKMDSICVDPEPLGVVLVIGAWNYPVLLLLAPLIGAISAGNCFEKFFLCLSNSFMYAKI